ncbi:hypothetical protein P3L10_001072 [Capsicum annuum]
MVPSLLALSEIQGASRSQIWIVTGYDSFCLIVQYLLTKLSSGTTLLYGFPWAFMLMDYPDEVSHPRMFRWLAAKSNTNIKEVDLFNPLDNAVVHPWIVPTEEELVMTSYITLGHIDTIADPTVELIKKEMAGSTAIRRAVRQGQPNVEALHDQPTKADPGASSGGVVGVGGRHADSATTYDDEHVEAQERINIFENTRFHPYTGASLPSSPLCSRCECKKCKDRQDKLFEKVEGISKAIDEFKSKRIIDLKFYKKFKDRYDQLNGEALALGVRLDFLVPTLVLDKEEMIKYVRGERLNLHGKNWTKAKRILAVISVNDMHYRAVEILLEEGKINIYDSNIPLIDDFDLFLLMKPLIVLLPILLKESKLMNHLPKKVLMKKL